MATVTLTEFNRNPSRVARLAQTEDVIVTDHGVASLEVRRVGGQSSRLDQLRRAGVIRPARDRSRGAFPDFGIEPGLADRLYEQFLAEDDREY
jgi:hypothetical protein